MTCTPFHVWNRAYNVDLYTNLLDGVRASLFAKHIRGRAVKTCKENSCIFASETLTAITPAVVHLPEVRENDVTK